MPFISLPVNEYSASRFVREASRDENRSPGLNSSPKRKGISQAEIIYITRSIDYDSSIEIIIVDRLIEQITIEITRQF